jgi:3-dehydroquinate dehydratase-2
MPTPANVEYQIVNRLHIAVINGPNLNLLGQREPAVYGRATLTDIETGLRSVATEIEVDISFAQFSGEGDIIDAIHVLYGSVQGIIINAGAYSHSSLATRANRRDDI